MRIPKPPFSFYRDCRVFGNSYSIYNCFGLGAYTTSIRYNRWLNVGMSYSFARLNTESFSFARLNTESYSFARLNTESLK